MLHIERGLINLTFLFLVRAKKSLLNESIREVRGTSNEYLSSEREYMKRFHLATIRALWDPIRVYEQDGRGCTTAFL